MHNKNKTQRSTPFYRELINRHFFHKVKSEFFFKSSKSLHESVSVHSHFTSLQLYIYGNICTAYLRRLGVCI